MPLIMEGRATDELTQERSRRDIFLGYRDEVLEELQEAVRFRIFLAELRHFLQYRLGVTLEHSEFEDKRRVEHLIRFFLERVHPFGLTAYHRRTTGNSLLRRIIAVLVVTYDATQQTDIRCVLASLSWSVSSA